MTTAAIVSFRPVARKEYLERLAALPPGSDSAPDLWTEVHEEIQDQLALLETEVRRRLPAVRVDAGQTKGKRFFLFSYRTFAIPGTALDPVVVGMTFTSAEQGIKVEADVSGEQTGDTIFAVLSKVLPHSREELLEAARTSARKLCESAEAIALALQDPSRRVE